MKTGKPDAVVGFGEVLWDILPDNRQVGGAPANFAFHAGQCGLNGWVVSAIGDDELGDELLLKLQEKNLNCIIERVPYPTGTVNVTLADDGLPIYEITEDVAWDHIPLTENILGLAANTKAVCFGTLGQRNSATRQTLESFLNAMPEDSAVIFDVNLRQNYYNAETLDRSMRLANVVKINDEELVALGRIFSIPGTELKEKSLYLLEKYELDYLILTCGVNGSYVFTPEKISYRPTPKVTVADTVGAGDAFGAAFMAGIMKGLPLEQAHENAVDVSAFVCTRPGAMPAIPDELREKL